MVYKVGAELQIAPPLRQVNIDHTSGLQDPVVLRNIRHLVVLIVLCERNAKDIIFANEALHMAVDD